MAVELIDAQVHITPSGGPVRRYPASGEPPPPAALDHASVEETLSVMDDAGVGGALLVVPQVSGGDNSYSLGAAAAHPGRFRVVGLVEPFAPGVGDRMRAFGESPVAVGVRIFGLDDLVRAKLLDGSFDAFLAAADVVGLAVSVYLPGRVADLSPVAARFPALQIVVDHLGLPPPQGRGAQPDDVSSLLELARWPNVTVKAARLAGLSQRGFPFDDVAPLLRQVLDVFGPDRVMWGSDWTTVPWVPYRQAVDHVLASAGLDEHELTQVMAATLRRVHRWTAPSVTATSNLTPATEVERP